MSKRVLFVDDEPNITSAMKHLLRKEKYEILSAASAEEALAMLEKQPVDVIVSDERMPGMPGSEFLMQVKQKYPETILMLLTGQASSEAALRAVNEVEVYRFLQKPCNGLDLLVNIRRALQYQDLLKLVRRLLQVSAEKTRLLRDIHDQYPDILKTCLPPHPERKEDPFPHSITGLLQAMDRELDQSRPFVSFPAAFWDFPSGENSSGPEAIQEKTFSAGTESKAPPMRQSSPEPFANPIRKKNDCPCDSSAPAKTIQEIKPIASPSEMYALLDAGWELKGMSSTVAQVLKITQNPRCSIESVANVIRQDHAISLKILKLANSAVYSRGEPLETISKAVMRIGLTQIRQMVMNIGVLDQFSQMEAGRQIDLPQFWEHSIAVGFIAAELARCLGRKEPQIEAAFTAGLLHDVGQLIYAEVLGERYGEVLKTAEQRQLPLEQVESQMLLVNHAEAAEHILRAWNFPADLLHPIAHHSLSPEDIRKGTSLSPEDVLPLALANRLAQALLLGTSGNRFLYPTEDFAHALQVRPEFFQWVEEKIPVQTDDMKLTMLCFSKQDLWTRWADDLAARFHEPFRPLYLGPQPELDALRIFCRRLTQYQEPDSPNIGILHIHTERQREALTLQYKNLEIEAGSVRLPLLIFSPKGNLMLEESFLQNRTYRLLPFPVSFTAIVNAFNSLVRPCVAAGA